MGFREHDRALPSSQLRIVSRILWDRARLALRGFRWTERPKSEIAPRDQARLALYRAAGRGRAMIDPVRAASFVFRGRLLAMSIGDRDFVTYFTLMEMTLRAGGRERGTCGVPQECRPARPEPPDPFYQAFHQMICGVIDYLWVDREFEAAFEVLARSDDALAQMANASTEQTAGRYFLLCSLHKMGDFARLRAYSERFLREAEQLRATLAVQDGELERAVKDFREVVVLGEAAHIRYITAAARRRLGVLVGGDEGRELVAAAERWMTEAGSRTSNE